MASSIDLRQVTDFLSKYQISQLNPETLVLTSKKSNFLIKSIRIDDDYDQIIQILDKHQSFDSEYVCPLLHFQQYLNQQGEKAIRAVYQLDKMTLKAAINIRKQNQQHFAESELWILLSSLVNSLIYLQQKDVVYGVLSPNKIYIQEKIRVMDPSAFNINPLNVSQISLHSPQIRINHKEIDFYQSDVYLLGLCILSAASLNDIANSIGEEEVQILLGEVEQRYSSDLMHVLRYMLKMEPQQRPTFHNIREYIETQIQIKQAKNSKAEPLIADEQDCTVEGDHFQEVDRQNLDILQNEQIDSQVTNEYELAKQKYLYSACGKGRGHNQATNCQSSLQSIEHMDSIEFIGQKDTINLKKSNYFVEQFKLTQCKPNNGNETVLKSKKRALQIKQRNSEIVKTIHSIMIPNQSPEADQNHPFTSPELMSMLKQETKRAKQFFNNSSRIIKD